MRVWKAHETEYAVVWDFVQRYANRPEEQNLESLEKDIHQGLGTPEDALPGIYLVAEETTPVMAIQVFGLKKDVSIGWIVASSSQESEDFAYYLQQFFNVFIRKYKATGVKSLFWRMSADHLQKNAIANGFEVYSELLKYVKKDYAIHAVDGLPVTIRPFISGDMEQLLEVERGVFMPEVWNDCDTFLEMAENPSGILLVAIFREQVLGYSANFILENGTGHLSRLGVHHDYQGFGVGKQLLAADINWFKERRVPLIELDVRRENIAARVLYEKFGFHEESAEYVFRYEGGLTDVIR